MLATAIDLVKWLAGTLEVAEESVERGLWWGLLGGLVFAGVHLVTMLATRWGDGDATAKSLIFSVLVHLSFAFGVVVVSPVSSQPLAPPAEEPVAIQEIRIESDEATEHTMGGNTPIWEKLPDAPEEELARVDRALTEFQPLEAPDRETEELPLPDLADVPDLKTVTEEPVVLPEPLRNADVGLPAEAVAPRQVDDATAEARPEVQLPSMSVVRRPSDREGLEETDLERQPTRGVVERVAPEFAPQRQLAAIDAPVDPSGFLKRGPDQPIIQRSTGPAPPTLPADDVGTNAPETTEGTSAGADSPPELTRLRTRVPQSREEGALERFRPERSPRTPVSIPEPRVAVRESAATRLPREGIVPNVVRPDFDAIRRSEQPSLPPTYRLRAIERRADMARKYGGTEESERAVEASLRWLALHQNVEGFWDADGFSAQCPDSDRCTGKSGRIQIDEEGIDRQFAGLHSDSGVTALAILAFLGAGYTHEEGQYADQVDRALSWLIRQQKENGSLAGDANRYAQVYCHAMATYALAEAYGMQSDRTTDTRLRPPLMRAVAYIIDNQGSDGGWRYVKGQQGDVSIFGWQMMALKSAEIAGISIPAETRDKLIQFLRDRSVGRNGGLAAYRLTDPPLPPTPSMTAEALFCKQMLGIKRSNPASTEAVQFLLQHLPKRSEWNLYYWYYGTLAMYQYGGDAWRAWNEAMRENLLAEQETTGHAAGSWAPIGPWGPYGGRVYSTAIGALCLEVYYRFLPLYQVGGQYTEE